MGSEGTSRAQPSYTSNRFSNPCSATALAHSRRLARAALGATSTASLVRFLEQVVHIFPLQPLTLILRAALVASHGALG